MEPTGADAKSSYLRAYGPERAAHYVLWRTKRQRQNRREIALVTHAFEHVPVGSSVLDAPCGGGRMAVELARMGYRVTASDASQAMLELARERIATEGLEVPALQEDLERCSFDDGAFDAVLCFRVFHHFPSDEIRHRVLGEICRVAGRYVLLSCMNRHSFHWQRMNLVHRLRGRQIYKFGQTPHEIARMLGAHGFRVIEERAIHHPFRSLRLAVAERTAPGGTASKEPCAPRSSSPSC